MEQHIPATLRPRTEPSSAGVDGPTGMVIEGVQPSLITNHFGAKPVSQPEHSLVSSAHNRKVAEAVAREKKRRGKQRAKSDEEPEVVQRQPGTRNRRQRTFTFIVSRRRMEQHIPATLRPRTEPSSAGVDGPTGMVIEGVQPSLITNHFGAKPVSQPEHSLVSSAHNRKVAEAVAREKKRRGKQRAKSDEEPESDQVPMSRSCIVRDVRKMQASLRDGPVPIIEPFAKPGGLRDSKGESRRRDAPSSLPSTSSGDGTVRLAERKGPRPGRWVESVPRKHTGGKASRKGAVLHREGDDAPVYEFPTIRAGDSDEYGEVPFYIQEDDEEEAGTRALHEQECMDNSQRNFDYFYNNKPH